MPFISRNDVLTRTSDGRNIVLKEPLEFASNETERLERFRAPMGTSSDGASTPSVIWIKFSPFGPWWLGSIIHDAAYRGTLERRTDKNYDAPAEAAWNKVKVLEDQLQRAKAELAAIEQVKQLWVPAMLDRASCDYLFLEAMASCGVKETDRNIIYEGVHLGGGPAFEDDRKQLSK